VSDQHAAASRLRRAAVIAILGVGALLVSAGRAQADTIFYASPTGSGTTCSSAEPCTLDYAIATKARAVARPLTTPLRVRLKAGTYRRTATLNLTSADSGTSDTNRFFIEPDVGATAILVGSSSIAGAAWSVWNPTLNIYKAAVPSGVADTRHLWVNGLRAQRARGEDNPAGFSGPTATGYTGPSSGPYATMQTWLNKTEIELAHWFKWKSIRCGVASISELPATITMEDPCWDRANWEFAGETPSNMWVENAFELLDEPGEFYFDKSGTIDGSSASTKEVYYIPRSGETISSATTEIARLSGSFLSGVGSLATPLKYVTVTGLTFSYNTWLEPGNVQGYVANQGGLYAKGGTNQYDSVYELAPAAVAFRYVRNSPDATQNVVVSSSTFRGLATAGVSFSKGARNNRVVGNVFRDLSHNGVQIGRVADDDRYGTVNIAPSATATASSSQPGYGPEKVKDEIRDGISEWRSSDTNPWVKLTFASQTVNRLVVSDTWGEASTGGGDINSATATFYTNTACSAGASSVTMSGIPTNGIAKELTFPAKTNVRCIILQATGGAGTGVGLAELRVLRDDANLVTRDNTVSNNYLNRLSVDFADAAAVFVGLTENTVVNHNEMHDMGLTGVYLGGFDQEEQYVDVGGIAKSNDVTNNNIWDFAKYVNDGGGVYTLGNQATTSTISGNYIHDSYYGAYQSSFYTAGVYHDADSDRFATTGNLITYLRNRLSTYSCPPTLSPYGDCFPAWFYIHNPWSTTANIEMTGNYADTDRYVYGTESDPTITIEPNTLVDPLSLPAGATTIRDNAGLEAGYASIKTGAGGFVTIANNGFEDAGLAGWATYGGSESRTSSTRRSGSYGLLMPTMGFQGVAGVERTVSLAANTWYVMRVWMKSAAGGAVYAGVYNCGCGDPSSASVTATSWTEREVIFKTDGTGAATIYVYKPGDSYLYEAWADDVSITKL
jgi:hypothetical protein